MSGAAMNSVVLSRGGARAYFGMQAVAGAAWWLGVFCVPAVRGATLGDLNPVPIAIADLPLFVVGSALAAAGSRWVAYVVTGWTALVALLMAVFATLTGTAGWGALVMVIAGVLSVGAAGLLRTGRLPSRWFFVGPFRFREARPVRNRSYLVRTLCQVSVFWGVFFLVFPVVIALIDRRWNLHVDLPSWLRIFGVVLLVAASGLGLWSAHAMATKGRGTPLPSATAGRLVIAGPYRYVRNPMAVAGLLQAASVGLLVDSWLAVLCAGAGVLGWNYVIRPGEERDLETRFGEEYRRYRRRVRCWIPRLRLPEV